MATRKPRTRKPRPTKPKPEAEVKVEPETEVVAAPEPADVAPQDEQPPQEALQDEQEPRVRKSTKRPQAEAPQPDPFPNGKQIVWVRNAAERPCVVGVKYLSPGEVRQEPWRHIKAVAAANPNILEWRPDGNSPWLETGDLGK